MAPIHSPTLAFFSVLLSLMRLALGQQPTCASALEKIISFTHDEALKLLQPDFALTDLQSQLILDDALISMMNSIHRQAVSLPGGRKRENEAFMLGDAVFGIPEEGQRSLDLTVKDPVNFLLTGIATILCFGAECNKLMDRLQMWEENGKLPCIAKDYFPQYFIRISPDNGIQITVPYQVVNLQNTFSSLINAAEEKKEGEEEWKPNHATMPYMGTQIIFNRFGEKKVEDIERVEFEVPKSVQRSRNELVPYVKMACALQSLKRAQLTFQTRPRFAAVQRCAGGTFSKADRLSPTPEEMMKQQKRAATKKAEPEKPKAPPPRQTVAHHKF